jgi:flagellar assembly protein FliH
MSLSDRTSRVIHGAADWQPLQISKLTDTHCKNHLTEAAESEVEAGIEARVAAAFQEGLAEGQYHARAEVQEREKQQVLSAQQRWSGLLDGLAQGAHEIESAMADHLLDLMAALGASIACREIAVSKDRIQPVLAEALKMITGACRQLEVTAHPSDCGAIETWLKPQCGEGTTLSIRADPSLSPGGCILRADDTTLDATVHTRIRRTLASLGIVGARVEDVISQALDIEGPATADAGVQTQATEEVPAQ